MFTKKLGTLMYGTGLMNHLSDIGAREEMRKLGEQDILIYIGEDTHRAQLFLEYVYVGNRVGTNVNHGILDKKTILLTWTPEWWIDLWLKLRPFIKKERQRRKNLELYIEFDRFIERIHK